MLAIQYLEASPDLARLSVEGVVETLRHAADRLELSHLLIGWQLPPVLLEACRAEAQRLNMRFLRWHPLLVGDAGYRNAIESPVVGLSGKPLPGFRNLPEFTFVCPNNPHVQEALCSQLEALVSTGLYQGFFLDRVRFPSPAADPLNNLGCFCEHCRNKAAGAGLDLEAVRLALVNRGRDPKSILGLVLALLEAQPPDGHNGDTALIRRFTDFRSQSIAELVAALAGQLQAAGLEVGLDCLAPCLAGMVGQDLAALSLHVDWIKIMTYAHALGPAGLPFELGAICDFLASATRLDDATILRRMAETLGRPLPDTRKDLQEGGLSSLALREEVEAGVRASRVPILAGLELVDLAGVANLNDAQIRADLHAVRAARPGGLCLSWDLRHIPLQRLDLVQEVYYARDAA